MKPKQKSEVLKKNNVAIHIDAKLTLIQKKLINTLLLQAYEDLLLKDRHQIDYILLCEMIGYNSHDRKHIKEALKALTTTSIEWGVIDNNSNESWEIATMLSYAKLENGICTYGYAKELAERLYNPETYTRINLEVQRKISTSYAFSLYENCLKYLKVGSTGWWSIATFRKLIGINDGEYIQFKELNKFVIQKAIKEVNKSTDIVIACEFQKNGKTVVSLKFVVARNKQPLLVPIVDSDEITNSKAYALLMRYGISRVQAREWIINYNEEYLLEKLELTAHAKAAGKLKSVSGFLSKAIADNYTNAEVNEKKAISEAKKKRELKASLERKIERLRADILKIERANRHERGRIVEAHIATLTKEDEERLGVEYAASLTNEFNRADFLKKRWASVINEASIVLFIGARYGLEYPSSDDTARALELPTIPALNAEIGQLHGEIKKND